MSEMVKQMRSHVASYKVLSRHRQNCLDMCDEIERLRAALEQVIEEDDSYYRTAAGVAEDALEKDK